MKKPRPKKVWRVVTKCCGTITRCRDKEGCRLIYVFSGGGKCIRCGWVWDMLPGCEATPISVADMKAAHS